MPDFLGPWPIGRTGITAKRVPAVVRYILQKARLHHVCDLRERLLAGAQGSGVTLSAHDCSVLAEHLSIPKQPKGASIKDVANTKYAEIAEVSFAHERAGKGRKSAIELTMQQFQCGQSTVYEARKLYKPSK
jgi:hypothetical protein